MSTVAGWIIPTPAAKYGLDPGAPASAIDSPLHSAGGPAIGDVLPPWHMDSPLFWFGAIAAATFGLLAVSTSVRVGPVRVAASAGS